MRSTASVVFSLVGVLGGALACSEGKTSASGADTLMRPESATGTAVSGAASGILADSIVLPTFDDYRVALRFRGRPAPVNLATDAQARFFRSKLREGARHGPNFADYLTVVTWGCGSGCQVNAIVDARTGRIHPQWLQTNLGVSIRRGSALLIADPRDSVEIPPGPCGSCGTPAAYAWRGDHLEPVGRGPHPHILPPSVRLDRFGH